MKKTFERKSSTASSSLMTAEGGVDIDVAPHSRVENISKITDLPCSHVMVNRCRIANGMKTLIRSHLLDTIASTHAIDMSLKQEIFPLSDSIDELKQKLQSTNKNVGQIVHRGYELHYIQDAIEQDEDWLDDRQIILTDNITEFGMGSIEGDDELVYLCFLFR